MSVALQETLNLLWQKALWLKEPEDLHQNQLQDHQNQPQDHQNRLPGVSEPYIQAAPPWEGSLYVEAPAEADFGGPNPRLNHTHKQPPKGGWLFEGF